MKLIDILVEELPKNGGWPDGIEKLEQYPDGSLFCGTKYKSDFKFPIVDDYGDDEVTRAEYEAALAAKNDGWIDWGGGECPVSDSTIVEVRYRNGEVKAAAPADFYEWGHGRPHFVTTGRDIIAYRLHKLQEAEQAKADGETDLNERANQDAAAVWNGEGLPPVGMEIEYRFAKVNYRTDFSRGKVLAYGMQNVFMEHWASKNEFIQPLDKIEFRPIRSEAEQKRNMVIAQMMNFSAVLSETTAGLIYDAIADGNIHGIRLED